MPDVTKYWVFQYGKRHVLAVPSGKRRIRAAGVASIPVHTGLSRLYKTVLLRTIPVSLDQLFASRHSTPVPRFIDFRWGAFANVISEILVRRDIETAVVQPPQSERNRFYVHVFSRLGTRLAFIKVSADAVNDRHLEREAAMLGEVARVGFKSFRNPEVLASGSFDGRKFLALGPLPARAIPVPPRWTEEIETIRKEIAGSPRTVPSHEALSWWPDFVSRAHQVPQLAAQLSAVKHLPAMVSRAHGDFAQWNLYRDTAGTRWLFDWESYAPDAPVLADQLRFQLGLKTRLAVSRPREVANQMYDLFQCEDMQRNLRFIRALAFLHAQEVVAARSIAELWSSIAST